MEKEKELDKSISRNRRMIFVSQALLMIGAAYATQEYVNGEFDLGVTIFSWLMLAHTYIPRGD